MSRGKKIAKAERRRRRERQDAEVARAAQELTDDIDELTCSNGAARATGNFTEAHLEDLDVDLDHAAAVSDLWSRNAPDHELTKTLQMLVAEYERHHEAVAALRAQLKGHEGPTVHHHIELTRDDFLALGELLVGGERLKELRLHDRREGHISTD